MKIVTKLVPVLALASLVGCSSMNSTGENVMGGAALGAIGGAAIGGIAGGSGGVAAGAAIGAGVGAIGGYMYDRGLDDGYDY